MFCSKCGSPVNEGEKFCSVCGQKAETIPVQQNQAQPLDQQPYVQQPYGQQPYGQQPYGQQPYGSAYANVPKKSKKGLLITVTLVAVLAIAAVALFLWPGFLTTGANSMQMKFLSDNGKVFSDAFSGMGSPADADKANQPFDMTAKMNLDMSSMDLPSQEANIDMAYDEEALGMSVDSGISGLKLLLLNDVLYLNTSGETIGIKFSTDEDLSKPMTLSERLTAILDGLVKDLGGKKPETEVDWNKLLVMAVNSIDKSNFEQTGSKTVLTLDADAIIDTMQTFRDSLSKDEKLLHDLESFIEEAGQDTDVLQKLDDTIKNMEDTKDGADFEVTWTVNYEGGKPMSIDLSVDSAGQKMEIKFGYENTENGKDVTLEMDSPGDYSDTKYDIEYRKNGDKLDYTLTFDIAGQTTTMNFTLTSAQDEDNFEGEMTMSPGGQTLKMTYDGTMKYGMPSTKVKDDPRFEVDTKSADIKTVSQLVEMLGINMFGSMVPTIPDLDSSVIPDDSSTIDDTSDYAMLDLDGVWESEKDALLFRDSYAYTGLSGANEDDILNDTAGVRGTKDGAMYLLMGDTLTIFNLDGTSVEMDWDGTNLWSADGTEYVPRADATAKTY